MIDLHSHLLPAVDDGSKSAAQSVAVLRTLKAAGVHTVALTPHLEASRIAEGPPPAHDEAFAVLTAAAPAGITLVRGAEVMLDRPLAPRVAEARRVTLGGTRFLLVEFTRRVAPRAAAAALAQVVGIGLVPVVAHPERYSSCDPGAVQHWRSLGAVIQVDATTLFQPTARGNRARALVASGLADILAADNHGDGRTLVEPFRRLTEFGFPEQANALMRDNPAAILADRGPDPVPPFDIPVSLFHRLKGWIDEMGV